MIKIDDFLSFLKDCFKPSDLIIDQFKSDLQFAIVDCFKEKDYKLTIELTTKDIKVSTISRAPELDFSLYEFIFDNSEDAEKFIFDISRTGFFPKKAKKI